MTNWHEGNPPYPGVYKVCCQTKGIEKVFPATWLGTRWLNDWVNRTITMWAKL
jgi:hypothetical protein